MWVIRWKTVKGKEVPYLYENGKIAGGHATKGEAITAAIQFHHKRLRDAEKLMVKRELYIDALRNLADKVGREAGSATHP